MATLVCQPGDPSYLKVCLLKELISCGGCETEEKKALSFDIRKGDSFYLELECGTRLVSANEVCRWICDNGRCGVDLKGCGSASREALVDYWAEWESRELRLAVSESVQSGSLSDRLLTCLGRLESHMTTCGGQYLLADALSMADVLVWATLYVVATPEAPTSKCVMKEYPSVSRWSLGLSKRTEFTTSVWKASDDAGYASYHKFVSQSRKAIPLSSISSQSKPVQQRRTMKVASLALQGGPVQTQSASASGQPQEEARRSPASSPSSESDSMAEAVSAADLEAAKLSWETGHRVAPLPILREHPILPEPGERNILITSALPYVNNVPHLGNIIGCVLSADVFARYCRLRNYRTVYICGTDEYGTATETKGLQEGLSPQEICQKYFEIHSAIYDWFQIEFDYFGRTSTPQQTEIAQDIFTRLNDRGYIRKDTVDQLLCEKCNMYLADRFVEGTCPLCSYEDARGDQCDKCGKLINATELKSPRCKMCSSHPVMKTSNHLFLDLSKLEPQVKDWFTQSSSEGMWTTNAEHITASWLRDGLNPRCITRDLKWGTPVPLEGYQDKVFYVWFDAPIGYLSITACYTKEWERWWKNPEDVQLYQFMAKDNVPFHTVVFPCSLIGAQDNYTLLNHISSTEYLNYEDGKFSKSRGVGVFGNNAKDTNIPADVFRFYLLYVRPESQDSAFNWADFVTKNNSELLNNLGNFVNRVLSFVKNNFDSVIQKVTLTDEDLEFIGKVNRELGGYLQCLEKIKIRDGLKHILSLSRRGNVYIQANKPWVLVKGTQEEKCRAGSVLGVATNVVCLLSVMIQPYMPGASKEIQQQLRCAQDCNVLTDRLFQLVRPGHRIGNPVPLFNKIEESMAKSLKERFAGKQQVSKATTQSGGDDTASLPQQLEKQATLVRELKAQGVPKERLEEEIKTLLDLKKKLGITQPTKGGKKSKKK